MPVLYTREYPHELFDINPELRCVFVESHERRGGGRSTVRVRQLEISLPLTLRDNFSSEGSLNSLTEARDIRLIEEEFQIIVHYLRQGVTICLPTLALSQELEQLKRQSPKVEQYLLKRLEGVKAGFPLQGL
jgi:hypothetical protein